MSNPRELSERADFCNKGLDCENNSRKKNHEAYKRERRQHDPSSPENEWRVNSWKRHRNRVSKASPIVDSSCPTMPPCIFTRSNFTYKRRLQSFVRIELENALLTKHLEEIFKGKNQLDNELSANIRHPANAAKFRLVQQLKVTRDNSIIARSLVNVQPTMSRRKQLDWYAKQELCMERLAKFPLYWKNRLCQPYESFAVMNASENHKPLVYFDIQPKGQEIGRVVIKLYSHLAPIAVENFRSLCKGGSFMCCQVDRIWPGMYYRLGKGAQSEKGSFPPQRFRMKHDQPGVVSLVNNGENLFDAEFMIIARELKPLDRQNLAIGKVIQGMEFLHSLEDFVRPNMKSSSIPIYIVETGEMNEEEFMQQFDTLNDEEITEEE